ncbi:MAG: ACT domain-containing protein [Bacillota bacterium]
MSQEQNYFIVEKSVLPEIFLKVIEVKQILESKQSTSIQEAVAEVGISRSAFYKYRDSVQPFYEHTVGRTVTMGITLTDKAGLLSLILNGIADKGANVLTINQMIPINGVAYLTIAIETKDMEGTLGELTQTIEQLQGVQALKMIARQ